ncbi:TetR/AcrR family transcriptional regulator [Kutzneria sp. CA-103260]|uniref:TetR/AcrR family transcriptional regulator n=1 Tax=Kutzneria sp. CA-103260 TaxID=2802641 RepID=UPI001BA735F2|nr:TetR family transcriptional regulator [Kutzneria sp. CA-103260]
MDAQPRQRLTRAEAKARTRTLLLDAAAEVFARRGFAGASVDEIAETAGFSIGAFYSNFANKDELFVELLSTHSRNQIAESARLMDERAEGKAELGRQLIAAADEDFPLLEAEFWLYSVRNPQVTAVLAERMREPREALQKLVGDALRRLDPPVTDLDAPVTVVVAALFAGLVRQRRVDPGSVSAELYDQALHWLFAGIEIERSQPQG